MKRYLRVGVLELISYTVASEWTSLLGVPSFKRQLYSIMPQVISTWCRQEGHHTTYATWYGQAPPLSLLPDDLDIVFIAASTQASALAYALGRVYRARGVRTVIGGAHAKCFPLDCTRFFDVTVTRCDRDLLCAILADDFVPGSIASSARALRTLPSVQERMPDIAVASFDNGRPLRSSIIALLSSLGCPYDCGFCTDWNSTYHVLDRAALHSDLAFVAERYPGTLLGFHDPNFGVRIDDTLGCLERIAPPLRSRYLMQCSLGILTPERLVRLQDTGCLYLAPGIESWGDFGRKLRLGDSTGMARVAQLVDRFTELRRFIPGLQANFVLGLDSDAGEEPFALTRDFIRAVPFVWPNINIPTPYGGTPLFAQLQRAHRLLAPMPLALYCAPYLAMIPRHYDAREFYEQFTRLQQDAVTAAITLRRLRPSGHIGTLAALAAQTIAVRRDLAEMRAIRDALRDSAAMRNFHAGKSADLPEFYRQQLRRRMGNFVDCLSWDDLRPVLGDTPAAPDTPDHSAGLAMVA